MKYPSAEIHVTKLAAARRQLREAIQMFFDRRDELAIHSVAAASYGVLKDLKKKRGRDEAGDNYLNPIFYAVRDYRRGTLPSYLADSPEALQWVRDMADQLPITAESKFEDIVASVSKDVARDYWNKRNAISNFLKHAEIDADSSVSLDDVDNLELLMRGVCAYIDLTKDLIVPEGFVLWIYFIAAHGLKEGLAEEHARFVSDLERLDPDERISFCASVIKN